MPSPVAGMALPVAFGAVRILHLSDLHLEPTPEERMPGVVATLGRDRAAFLALEPELVIVSGDLTTYGCSEPGHLQLAKDFLDGLGLPYLVAAGNHDLGANQREAERDPRMAAYEDVPYGETGFGRTFGPELLATSDLGMVRVVGIPVREGDPDDVLPALDTYLSQDDRPVIAFSHYPVVDPRERIEEYFGSSAFVPQTALALHELIRAHQNVRLYAAGHVHVSSTAELAPHCLQVTAGSVGQGASAYRVYDLDTAGLTYSTVLGSGPLAFWPGIAEPEFHLGYDHERTGKLTW